MPSVQNGHSIPAAEVLQQLERVLASDSFRNAGRLSRFLRFAVERTVQGDASQLKEYVVGMEVFDRTSDYDPRLDPVVRVEARRLRSKLVEYYGGTGKDDPVQIVLPKGSYVPEFGRQGRPRTNRVRMLVAAGSMVLIAGIALGLILRSPAAPLNVAVLPMRAFSTGQPEDPKLQSIADSLTESVIIELARDRSIQVLAWPAASTVKEGPGMEEIGQRLNARAIAGVYVVREGDFLRISSHMLNVRGSGKLWADSWTEPESSWPVIRDELSRRIAMGIRERLPRQVADSDNSTYNINDVR